MLTRAGCETRQKRFRAMLERQSLDAAVITDFHEIQYLTGFPIPRFPMAPYLRAMLYMETDGQSLLVTHTDEGEALADRRAAYPWNTLATANPDQLGQLIQTVEPLLSGLARPRRLGWQAESLPRVLAEALAEKLEPDEWVPIDEQVAAIEKRKDPDEVELLRLAIACNLAAYDAVQRAIAPGVDELAVLEAGHTAATLRAGEVIEHGGDYACGEVSGPARNRLIAAGELYIIDMQSRCRGYWSDLSRTYPVGSPTSLQREVYAHVAEILADVPRMVQPGMHATELWRWIDRRLREHPHLRERGFIHHGGHGVGLRPHEAPDINRDRGGIFEVGDVFSCEPGAYSPELNTGVRLENTFLLTESGVEILSDYPILQL